MARDTIIFKMTGGKEVIAAFNALPPIVAAKLVKPVLTAVAKPLVKDAKARVAVTTGTLKKSIGSFMRKQREPGLRLLVIGARTDAGTTASTKNTKSGGGGRGGASQWWGEDDDGNVLKPENYSHLVEFGTVFSGPRPFLRTALDDQGAPAINIGLERMRKGIEREATKLGKKVSLPLAPGEFPSPVAV